ncbi:MAG: protein translocase subunit SecF, partial [Candidatus Babeliales bacterium]
VELIKAALEKNGWRNPVIREFGDKEYLVRVKDSVSDVRVFSDQMKHAIMSDAAISQITILQEESVGPGIGEELRWKSVRAIGVALLVLLIYITLVFRSYAFAVGAVVALVHDALAMLALFLLVDRDISLNVIAAILAVLGYSINDTIVIFSSIKKNLQDSHGLPLYAIVNKSIQHMLRRTLLTSISTALTVGSLLLFGGEALKDFSLTFLIGIIFGTYSSIYIASPVMMLLYKEGQK